MAGLDLGCFDSPPLLASVPKFFLGVRVGLKEFCFYGWDSEQEVAFRSTADKKVHVQERLQYEKP